MHSQLIIHVYITPLFSLPNKQPNKLVYGRLSLTFTSVYGKTSINLLSPIKLANLVIEKVESVYLINTKIK